MIIEIKQEPQKSLLNLLGYFFNANQAHHSERFSHKAPPKGILEGLLNSKIYLLDGSLIFENEQAVLVTGDDPRIHDILYNVAKELNNEGYPQNTLPPSIAVRKGEKTYLNSLAGLTETRSEIPAASELSLILQLSEKGDNEDAEPIYRPPFWSVMKDLTDVFPEYAHSDKIKKQISDDIGMKKRGELPVVGYFIDNWTKGYQLESQAIKQNERVVEDLTGLIKKYLQ